MAGDGWIAVEVERAEGTAPLVLACEHASCAIPPELGDLGLAPDARRAHVAWDIGAAALARDLSARLAAPLVLGALSRLVYDVNRPRGAPDAIPARSEAHEVPGNRDLDDAARTARHARVHVPFHAALARTLAAQDARAGGPVALVTVHSFTPVFHGVPRDVELGFLHHDGPPLAAAMLRASAGLWRAALDAPYSAADGVTHTLARHGGRASAMIEVRQDLLDGADAVARMGEHLARVVTSAAGPRARAAG